MSSPRWIYLLWIGCVSTSAMLVPAGMVTVEVSAAGFADATADWVVFSEAGGWFVCAVCCAKLDKVMSKVVAIARPCLILVLARNKRAVVESVNSRRRCATVVPPVEGGCLPFKWRLESQNRSLPELTSLHRLSCIEISEELQRLCKDGL